MITITNETNTLQVTLGQKLFEFTDFDKWVNKASSWFRGAGIVGKNYHICLDTKGRVCNSGREFMRARDDNSFPVTAYLIT